MVPEQPTATSKPMSRASRAAWATNDLIWRRQALTAPSAITPPSKKRSVSRMWPSLRLRASAAGAWSPTISSVEPPPMSMTMWGRPAIGTALIAPRWISRASSMPETISTVMRASSWTLRRNWP